MAMSELEGKRILVLGLARTGSEVVRFLTPRGAEVWVTDCRRTEELRKEVAALSSLPVRLLLGGEDLQWLDGVEMVVPSPGVPSDHPLLIGARGRGIEIVSEIELAFRYCGVPLVAVTGTNGKSTTTMLIGEILKQAGMRAFVGGNVGVPLIAFVSGEWDWGAVEVSSFQLEWVERFRPKIGALLNLSEDHLDRYSNFAAYCETKARIFRAQGEEDLAVLNRDDPLVWSVREKIISQVLSFGWNEVDEGVFVAQGELVYRAGGVEDRFDLSGVRLQGVHNLENLMAAVGTTRWMGVPPPAVQQVMNSFAGLEHRLEFVREKDGVRYYNDSKGTNVGAVYKSLSSFSGPVILIAGGVDKKGDYRILEEAVRNRVKKLILFGAAREVIREALGRLTHTVLADSLETAVEEAGESASAGDVVLLSPACSSFDMFRDYAERGERFKALVQRL